MRIHTGTAMQSILFFLCAATGWAAPDPMWLRYTLHPNATALQQRIARVTVIGDEPTCADADEVARLTTVAAELGEGLSAMLGRDTPTSCCNASSAGAGALVVTVSAEHAALGAEGFAIANADDGVAISASTGSGALYGAFRLLAYLQRREEIPISTTERPAMTLRVWDLWDNLNGRVERGYGGDSFVWPYALFDPARPPPPTGLYLFPCNASDPLQRWSLDANASAPLVNEGVGRIC